jgi:hypothetical protein
MILLFIGIFLFLLTVLIELCLNIRLPLQLYLCAVLYFVSCEYLLVPAPLAILLSVSFFVPGREMTSRGRSETQKRDLRCR